MLAKCANPECSNVFRYHRSGKLFRTQGKEREDGSGAATMEHFWLCADCAATMTMAVEPSGRVLVIPRDRVDVYREAVGSMRSVPQVSFSQLPIAVAAH